MQKTTTCLAVLGLALGSLAAAQESHRIIEEEGLSLTVEWTREDGSTYRTAETPGTLEQTLARKRATAARLEARKRRKCDARLEDLSRALDNLTATERTANLGRCSNISGQHQRQLCEAKARGAARFLPNQREHVAYSRRQANLVCDSAVLGTARPQALPVNLETVAQDVLAEALARILGAATQ